MPLWRFFAARGAKHPTGYAFLTLGLGMLASMVIAVTISVTASNRAIRQNQAQEHMERQRAAAASERNRQAVCLVIGTMRDVYKDPSTKTGEAAGLAWQDLHRIFRCDER